MIPEIYITCNGQRYFINEITVKQYMNYASLMKKNDSDMLSDAMWFNLKIVQEMFKNRMSLEELENANVVELIVAAKTIHFIMQDIITPKFLELSDEEPIEQEKSAFDEYDKENGYEEEDQERNIWKICSENIDRVIKIAIKLLNNSYSQCLETDIIALLDHMKFQIKTINENS